MGVWSLVEIGGPDFLAAGEVRKKGISYVRRGEDGGTIHRQGNVASSKIEKG